MELREEYKELGSDLNCATGFSSNNRVQFVISESNLRVFLNMLKLKTRKKVRRMNKNYD